jgi:phosphatidylserine/phosphatidylglycerophosphate/cardiolipin synthase-like enzyme
MTNLIKILSGRQYPQEVIPLINSAKNSIKIIVFDWRWYSRDPGSSCQLFNQAILSDAKRGV